MVYGLGFRVQGLGFRVQDSGWIYGSGFRVQGSGFRVQGLWRDLSGDARVGFRVACLFQVQEFRVQEV